MCRLQRQTPTSTFPSQAELGKCCCPEDCTLPSGDEPHSGWGGTRPPHPGTWMEDPVHTKGNPCPSQATVGKTEAPIPGTSISPKFVKMHFGRLFDIMKIFLTQQNWQIVMFRKEQEGL